MALNDQSQLEYDQMLERERQIANSVAEKFGGEKIPHPMESRIKDVATEFFYHWYNAPGNNTQQGFDDWWEINKQRFGF